jgi:hAT family C-terminal dimerisation region
MTTRAYYLRKAFDEFVNTIHESHSTKKVKQKIASLKVSEDEWEQIRLLTAFLLPFRSVSNTLEETSRIGINHAFWAYEVCFNRIDKLQETLTNSEHKWATSLLEALSEMRDKLSKYYSETDKPFIYPDATILQPHTKLVMFDGPSWEKKWKKFYSDQCRRRYVEEYEIIDDSKKDDSSKSGKKRKRPTDESWMAEDEVDDYLTAIRNQSERVGQQNEYDRWIRSPTIAHNENIPAWWRANVKSFPNMGRMYRDTCAAVATGAGVEREFSKSGRVATWQRARLSHKTITETMILKAFLRRQQGQTWSSTNDVPKETSEEKIDEQASDEEDELDNAEQNVLKGILSSSS